MLAVDSHRLCHKEGVQGTHRLLGLLGCRDLGGPLSTGSWIFLQSVEASVR